ncbi:MAG: histidine kinase [Bacteroidota bacterium]|nr:histidine kinase [Bacteroidota bacterium]
MIYKYNKNLKIKHYESINNLLIGQLEERKRISRDLHDSLNPQLSAIYIQSDGLNKENYKFEETKTKIKNELTFAIKRIREISHDLMPIDLEDNEIYTSFKDIILKRQTEHLSIVLNSNTDGLKFDNKIKFHLVYILLELIQNSLKHSEASKIEIILNYDKSKKNLHFKYMDNGKGIDDNEKKKQGIGLKNIITRILIIGGEFEIISEKGFELN